MRKFCLALAIASALAGCSTKSEEVAAVDQEVTDRCSEIPWRYMPTGCRLRQGPLNEAAQWICGRGPNVIWPITLAAYILINTPGITGLFCPLSSAQITEIVDACRDAGDTQAKIDCAARRAGTEVRDCQDQNCKGYATCLSQTLNQMGISSTVMVGYDAPTDLQGHAWVMSHDGDRIVFTDNYWGLSYDCPDFATVPINVDCGWSYRDEQCYLWKYDDVRNAVDARSLPTACAHYLWYGRNEGRTIDCDNGVPGGGSGGGSFDPED